MPAAYQSPNWATHTECEQPLLDFLLFDRCPEHFAVRRKYQGPAETYVAQPLDAVDAVFDGVAKSISGTAATDLIEFTAAHQLTTGTPITLAVSSGLAGLAAGTYYFVRVSSTTGQLATTAANAKAGTVVNITSDGTGTLTPPVAYLVGETPRRDADGGQIEYERTYATIPASWSEPEEYPFTYPGYAATSLGGGLTVSAITASGINNVLSMASTSGILAGTQIYVAAKFTRSGKEYYVGFFTKAESVVASTSVTIAGGFPGSGTFSSITATVRNGTPGRTGDLSMVVPSRLVHDYALGAATTLETVLPLIERFSPIDSTGVAATILSTGAATFPNSADYSALVATNGELVAETSARRRYLGNIFVRITRLVPAR
ncbi:MAG TPA: hypothetical protein VLH79_06835 [Chthonomonadales bacterium]|nr:hypothetical protein [Chthonomonadales bacterium]